MSNYSPQEPDSRLKIIRDDLDEKKDKDLYKVNQVINDLYTKIDTLRIDGHFYGKSQFADLWLNTNRDPATLADQEVLNLGEIRRLNLEGTTTTTTIVSGGGGGGGSVTPTVQYPPATSYLDAVSRVLGEKFGETISILDFGAVADDGTTDNSVAINKAVAAAMDSGRGKSILIPAAKSGTFYGVQSKIEIHNKYFLHGTVDVAGTAITWVSGDEFPDYLGAAPYTTIDIAGTDYTISAWVDSTHLTLASGPTVTGATFSTESNYFIPIQFKGEGALSSVKRTDDMAAGEGVFDIQGEGVVFYNFCMDGGVTTPTGLLYATFSSEPMNPLLTLNTSFWVHGPSADVIFNEMTITHTGGYAILVDATNASGEYDANSYDVKNTRVLSCNFLNNRPHLFGTTSGQEDYGSWTGGVFLNTYGLQDAANYLSTTYNTLIQGCYFEGNTGNCVWSHLQGFDVLHSDLRCLGNTFIDNGLDCILYGGITGGSSVGNRSRRTGYIATDPTQDVSIDNPTVPKWLAGLNATAFDSSGICKNVAYANNTAISTNGGDFDLDGFCDGQFTGNVSLTPRSYDPEYVEDSIAVSGPSADGVTWSYGVQPSNSYGEQWGAVNVSITGNSFINKYGGAIRLAACRNAYVSGNNINHPAVSGYGPILLFNIGTGAEQRTYDTVVCNNAITWDPAAEAACIQELGDSLSFPAFQPGDKNWVHNNQIIGDVFEFLKDADTDSTSGVSVSLSQPSLTAQSDSFVSRLRSTVTGNNFDYLLFQKVLSGTPGNTAFLTDNSFLGVSGYVNTSGTAVSWVSGDQFTSYSNGGNITINAVSYTISTVNSAISITLTGSAGTQSAVTHANPITQLGAPLFNVGNGTSGSITTGNRTDVGFDDVVATGVLQADGFLVLTGTNSATTQKANKLDDTYGLIRYNDSTKVLQYSNSATSGVRNWSNFSGGAVAGSDSWVQYNNGGSFGAETNFAYNDTLKRVTVTGLTGTPGLLVDTSYVQSTEGYLSTSDSYGAINGWIPTSNIGGGALLSGLGLGPTYYQGTVNTSGTAVTWVSGGLFTAGMAGQAIVINSVSYTVSTFTDSTHLVLTGSAGTQTGVSYYSYYGARGGYLDIAPLAYANFPTPLTGLGSFGANDPILWVSATNGTSTPVTTYGFQTNAFINAKSGFATEATATNAIQAASGGVTAKYLIGTTSLTLTGETAANAGLSTSTAPGSGRIYFDDTARVFKVSQNGGAYVNLIGSGSVSGSDTWVQYNDGGAFGSEAAFTYDKTQDLLTVSGYVVSGAGFTAVNNTASASTGSITLIRTSATSRVYTYLINSSGTLILNDVTAAADRWSMTTAGLITIGSTIQLNQAGAISASGVITSTGASGGFNVTTQTAVNSIQTTGGVNVGSGGHANGIYRVNSTTVIDASRNGIFAGVVIDAAGQLLQGSDTRINTSGDIIAENGYYINNGTTYTGQTGTYGGMTFRGGLLVGGSFTAVTSATGTANQVTVSASTGAVTWSLPSTVIVANFDASTAFKVGGTSVIDSSRNGSFVAITGTGNISSSGGYINGTEVRVAGNVVINSSGILSNSFGVDVNAGVAGTGFNIHGGASGVSGTWTTVDSKTITATNGIITSIV